MGSNAEWASPFPTDGLWQMIPLQELRSTLWVAQHPVGRPGEGVCHAGGPMGPPLRLDLGRVVLGSDGKTDRRVRAVQGTRKYLGIYQ